MSGQQAARAFVMGDRDLAVPLHAAGAPVTMVSPPVGVSRFSRYVSGWLQDPRPDEDALLAGLLAEARRGGPVVLFYQGDEDLLFVSRRRDELSPTMHFAIPTADLVEKLVDKAAFQELATQEGLPVPYAQVLDLARPVLNEGLSFPLLVKPQRRERSWNDSHPAKAALVHDRRELDSLVTRLAVDHDRLIIQRPVPGPETRMESYHVYVDSSGRVAAEFTGQKLRTYPMAMGHSTAVVTTEAPDVAHLGRSIVEQLQLRGVAKLDFKRDDEGRLWLLEVNPRFNLWHHVGAAAGVNIPAFVWADLLGLPRPARTPARSGVAWCRVERDRLAAREAGIDSWRWLRWAAGCETRSGLDPADPLSLLAGKVVSPIYRKLRSSLPVRSGR